MKKMLIAFAIIVFLVALILAFYFGITLAKEIVVTVDAFGITSTKEKINFGTFMIHFLKYIAIGLFGGGMLLAAANKVNDY